MRDTNDIVRLRTEELLIEEVGPDLVIYDLRTDHAHMLNESTAIVWRLADGSRTVADITPLVCARLGVESNEAVVWEALDQLANAGLTNATPGAPSVGLSRRKLLRNIGLAAAAAPVVVSILAPTAAMATSNRPNGAACGNACDCASRQCSSGICTACTTNTGSPPSNTCQTNNTPGTLTFNSNSCTSGVCSPSGNSSCP